MGQGDVAKRIEIVVSALSLKAPVKEIAAFDLAYAPPFFSRLWIISSLRLMFWEIS